MKLLPFELTALYRLFLRASSAAVLHNGPATRGLRRLYRPSFEAAASAVRRLESLKPDSAEAENVRRWMETFDERINNTLTLMHTSAHSRGLPHNVISRLFLLSRSNYPWSHSRTVLNSRPWLPHLDPKSPEYTTSRPTVYSPNARKNAEQKKREHEEFGKMWGALGECVSMAEGRDGLVLGKVRFKAQKFRKKKVY